MRQLGAAEGTAAAVPATLPSVGAVP